MNPREAAELLGHCSAFDNRKPSQAAAVAWASSLHDVPLDDDTKGAVAAYYSTPPKDPDQRLWILPHHVRTLRSKIRSARLENFQYEPAGIESVPEYLDRYRRQVQAIACGYVAPPTNALAWSGGPHKDVADVLEGGGIGRRVPDSGEESLADVVRRSGPLGIRCPSCEAAVGRPCRTPGGGDKQPLGRPRRSPHSARLRAASGAPGLTVEQQAAEEERRREVSRRYLASLGESEPSAVPIPPDNSRTA